MENQSEEVNHSVNLVCVNEGKRLRVRITTPGYINNANCQFPRNIRVLGRKYQVPASAVVLKQRSGCKYFYHINKKDVVILEETTETPKVEKVFGDDDEDVACVICLDAPKTLVIVPCGHYCLCKECAETLKSCASGCPLCRAKMVCVIDRSMVE